jgi:hypothetical protein
MKVEIIGTLELVQQPQTTDSGFTWQTVVIKNERQYSNLMPVKLVKEDIGKFDDLEIGTRVKVAVFIGGREWNGKYFADIDFAELLGVQRDLNKEPAPAPQPENRAQPPSKPAKQTHMEVDTGEDVPF